MLFEDLAKIKMKRMSKNRKSIKKLASGKRKIEIHNNVKEKTRVKTGNKACSLEEQQVEKQKQNN